LMVGKTGSDLPLRYVVLEQSTSFGAICRTDYPVRRSALSSGLTFPVVPRGDETIRFQINPAHAKADINEVLKIFSAFKDALLQ